MFNKQLLIDILSVQSETYNSVDMENFIMDRLDEMYLEYIIDNGNIYVTKGDASSYPCIVSHMDTVHKIIPQERYKIMQDDYCAMGFDRGLNMPTGCGGDDKVGIFICLTMLQYLDNVKVVFFRDEEVGCVGSSDAHIPFFDDARFILQCDRKGNKDFVNNIFGLDLQSSAFSADVLTIIKRYGYEFSDGGMTDVYQLALDGVGVSVANMSCGYHNPHSDDEIVVFDEVENCMSMVYDIMTAMTDTYKHKADRSYAYGTGYYGGYGGYTNTNNIKNYADDSWDSYDSWLGLDTTKPKKSKELDDNHFLCEDCGNVTEIDEAEYIQDFNAIVCKCCFDIYEQDVYTAQAHVENNVKNKKKEPKVKQTFDW
jgi:tripeptide aminopeptidase